MAKEMLINVSEGEECRIALLEDGKLEELYMERTSSTSHVGNIYKGRVTNVEPSIQAAFIDFGLGRNGFLHISDLMPTYFGRQGEDIVETVGKKMARRDRPPIQRCLRRGDDIVVQIIKEGIGTKGPTLSTYLSVPGRILVMMPGMGKMGVSRKIEDDQERRRLRQILDGLKPPDEVGFIIRTAGVGKSKTEIERDLKYLTRLWENLVKKRDSGPGPMELYTEGDLVTRTVRDVFTADVERIIIDNPEVAKRVKEVIKLSSPRTKDKVEVYDEPIPLFHKYGIEREIELMYSRHVPLASGGSLVIDSTEAIVAIDVNSGKFRDHSDAEMTAFKTDMEAADEIARQLRLRDLGGVIICDFIDLRYERHRRDLEQRLLDHLKHDRAKTKMLRMSQFGIIEMTRQRMRPSYKRAVYFDCPHCKGAGLVKTPESMSLDVMRRLAIAVSDQRVQRIDLAVCPDVAFYLQNKKRASLANLENHFEKRIIIRSDVALGLDEMKLDMFDSRDGLVVLEELGAALTQPPHKSQLSTRPYPPQQSGRGGGRFDNRRQPQGGQRRPPQEAGKAGGVDDVDEERYIIDRDEDEAEDRELQPVEQGEPQGGRDERRPSQREEQPRGRGDGDRGRQRDQRPPQRDDRNRRPQGRDQRGEEFHDDDRDREPGHQDRGREDRQRPQDRGMPPARGRDQQRGGQPQRTQQQHPQQQRGQQQGRPPQQGDRPQQGARPQQGGRPQQGWPPRQGQPAQAQRPDMHPDDADAEGPEESLGNAVARDDGTGEGQGGRRRRRRRGRRGRGRGGQNGQGEQRPQDAPASGDRVFDESYGDAAPEEALAAHEADDRGRDDRDDRGDHDFADHDRDTRNARDDDSRDDSGEQRQHPSPRSGRGGEAAREAADAGGTMEVEEPVIEADAQGRILSETVETTPYSPASPAGDAGELGEGAKAGEAAGATRRRGGRGRRKAPGAKTPAAPEAPESEAASDQAPAEEPKAKPKRATRSRARTTRSKAAAAPATAPEPAPVPAPKAAARIAPPNTVIRTGSGDKHLVEDDSAAQEPTRRPRSFRDLDAIPEEFD